MRLCLLERVDTHTYMCLSVRVCAVAWRSLPDTQTNGPQHIHINTPIYIQHNKGWFREQLEKAKGRVASGVVVGEYSLDFKSYPSLTGQLTGEQLVGLQQLLLAEQRQFGVVGPNPSVCMYVRIRYTGGAVRATDLNPPSPI